MDWKLPQVDTYFAPILKKTPEGFELDHLEFALKHCRNFRVAIDGGAHIGTWTVAMAKRFQRVFAFEPAKDTFECLMYNTKELKNVTLLNLALGPMLGKCAVEEDPTSGNTGSRVVNPNGVGANMVSLDGMLLGEVDFLKLDVEGYELEVLHGAEEILHLFRPTVMIECKAFTPPRYGGPEFAKEFLRYLNYVEVGGVRNDRVFVPKEFV